MLLIIGLILFVILVIIHEYGHFLVAKRNGVEIEEFGVGFPPRLYGKTMGKGIFKGFYSINALPLGGFVKLKGEHDADTAKGTYGAAPLPAKIRIMLAGVAANFVVAIILFTIVAWIGMPQLVDNQFKIASDNKIVSSRVIAGYVVEGSPAENSGIKPGDIIKSINGQSINSSQVLRDATKSNAGKYVEIVYNREGQQKTARANLIPTSEVEASKKTDNPKGHLGVSTSEYKVARSTWSAPIVAVGSTLQFTGLTFKGLGNALASLGKATVNGIKGQEKAAKQEAAAAGENVSGPVGIYYILKQGTTLGFQFTLFVIALISLTLAIMNILPIPALDGGRVTVTLAFRAFKKPLTPRLEELIHGAGFAALMILFIVITVVDIKRFL
jgi:regulator of sigma E protease